MICCVLDLQFVYVLCMAMPLYLWCRIVIDFHGFSSCFLIVLVFYVLRVLGIGLGKRKVNGSREELNETQQVR